MNIPLINNLSFVAQANVTTDIWISNPSSVKLVIIHLLFLHTTRNSRVKISRFYWIIYVSIKHCVKYKRFDKRFSSDTLDLKFLISRSYLACGEITRSIINDTMNQALLSTSISPYSDSCLFVIGCVTFFLNTSFYLMIPLIRCCKWNISF